MHARRSRLILVALAAALVASLATAEPGSAVTVEPIQFSLVNYFLGPPTAVSSSPSLVRDEVILANDAQQPLTQGTFVLDRSYNPATMKGTVSGTVGGTGPINTQGTLHGVITPDGMSGTFSMVRTDSFSPQTWRINGTWSSEGQPATEPTPSSRYTISFVGRIIGPFGS
jgi:hypothetical protein